MNKSKCSKVNCGRELEDVHYIIYDRNPHPPRAYCHSCGSVIVANNKFLKWNYKETPLLAAFSPVARLIVYPDIPGPDGLDTVCLECCRKLGWNTVGVPIYKENILPYKARCHECDKTIVAGGLDTYLFGRKS